MCSIADPKHGCVSPADPYRGYIEGKFQPYTVETETALTLEKIHCIHYRSHRSQVHMFLTISVQDRKLQRNRSYH